MADRTSANIFSMVFEMLAKNPTDEHKEMAWEAWSSRREYDFSDEQMGCDEALLALGLAHEEDGVIKYEY